jgi:phosphatidylinositol alpha-mannosyltransferase
VLVASSVVVLGLTLAGAADIGVGGVAATLAASKPGLLTVGLGLMCTAMLLRGLAWHAILRAAPTWRPARVSDALQGTFIGVLMSATLPARLGEPAKALVVAQRVGRARETMPLVLGTMISQMLFNLVAVAALGVVGAFTVRGVRGPDTALMLLALVPVAGLMTLVLAPLIVPGAQLRRSPRPADLPLEVRAALRRARRGLRVFLTPHRAAAAALLQLSAWGLQLLSCWFLLAALGLAGRVDMAGAAAILFAVNVTALLPATPANVGVFQAAVLAVLVGVFRVSPAVALAYGIVLQAAELLAAFAMGMPALAKEGLTLRELRVRTLHAAPVKLGPLPTPGEARHSQAHA